MDRTPSWYGFSLWQENIGILELTWSYEIWADIKVAVEAFGTAVTINKQCKEKMENINGTYKRPK